jgi:SAM-dependent methyltransferase
MQFLDVAAGSGGLSIPAARLGAQVVAVDFAPNMVARLQERARAEGLANLTARVMDGQALELDDDSFDIAGSQFGVMLFPDLPQGLRELARVTKPGGHVLMVAFGDPGQVEFLQFFIRALQAVVPDFTALPDDPPPLPFQVADPAVLRQRLAEAGLRDIRIEHVSEPLEFHSATQMWDWVINSNPVGAMLVADLTEAQCEQVRQELERLLRERSGGTWPAVLTSPINIAIGTK